MSRRRIVYLSTGLNGGGAEYMLLHIARGIDRERFELSIISLMDKGKLGAAFEELGIPVHTLKMRAGKPAFGGVKSLISILRWVRPHVVQGWMYHGNLAAQLGAMFSGVPVCWCIQNSFESFSKEKPLTRVAIRASALLSRLPAKIVFVSHVSRKQHEQLGFAGERLCVIPNGADPDIFRPSTEARGSVREELGISSKTVLIGLIARFHPQKDHANFFSAAARLARQRGDVHFVVAGAGIDPENVAFAKLTGNPELRERVHVLGERNDIARITAALDIGTSSSAYGEGLSLAIAEAMACEVPCVVTDVGDSAILVGDTGVVVPPCDSEALCDAWMRLIDSGHEKRSDLGRVARRRVEESFCVRSSVSRYQELYQMLT